MKSELHYQEILNPDFSLPTNPNCISSKISLAKIRVVLVETFTIRISTVKIRVKFVAKFSTRISTFKMIKVAFVTKFPSVPPKTETCRFSGWQKAQRLAARSGIIGGHHSYEFEGKCAWAIYLKADYFLLVRL